MTTINQLTNETWSSSDKIPKYSGSNGVDRQGTVAQLQTYMQNNLTFGSSTSFTDYTTQYASPTTGQTVSVTDSNVNTHLILTPSGTLSTLTIKLPALANLVDKQDILVNCTQAVTTLTVDGNGAGAVTGEPASLSANDFFRLKYDAITDVWYRIG
jgi:hypothetical protein